MKDKETKDKEKNQEGNQAERLLKIAEDYLLFHDQNKESYVFLNNEVVPLRAKRMKQLLAYKLYENEHKAPNTDALNQAITVLEGKAIHECSELHLYNRIAEFDDAFWYDLGKGRAVKITSNGWDILDAPILFKRYSHQEQQVDPIKGGNPREVFNFLNIGNEHQLLLLVYLVSCFIPEIPHPIFHPHGSQGSGKTTLCRVIKRLCDPSTIETIITPRDVAQLVQVIAHHHVCLFDNMSNLPPWMSDVLAQACTGGGFSKRQLFTDDEDIIYQVKRCIGLNGINLLISKADLMDRSILITLDRIKPSKRIDESEFWKSFEDKRPAILGGILDTLSKAMSIYPQVNLQRLPRMADFVKWGYAIACALGVDGEHLLHTYKGNIEKQNEEVIQGNTLAQSVLALMEENSSWDGTIKEAWETLHAIANPTKGDYSFPKTERSLRKHLERIKTNLADIGVTFQIGVRGRDGIPISFLKIRDFTSLGSQVHNTNNDNVCVGIDKCNNSIYTTKFHAETSKMKKWCKPTNNFCEVNQG